MEEECRRDRACDRSGDDMATCHEWLLCRSSTGIVGSMTSKMFEAPMWDKRYATDDYVFGTNAAAPPNTPTGSNPAPQHWSSPTGRDAIRCSWRSRASE